MNFSIKLIDFGNLYQKKFNDYKKTEDEILLNAEKEMEMIIQEKYQNYRKEKLLRLCKLIQEKVK